VEGDVGMNNLLYFRNTLAIYFSSLTLPDLIMDRIEDERGYEYLQMLDAGDRDSMIQIMTSLHHIPDVVYYVLGRYGQDTGRDIFILSCGISSWVWLI